MKNFFSMVSLSLAALVLASCSSTPAPSAAELKAPFIDNKSEIEACYEKVLKKQPDLGAGTVELKFLINEEGQTYKTIFLKKKSTLQSKLLNACIKKAVATWQFPKGKKMEISYPFQFEQKTAEAGPLSDESKAGEPAKNENLDIINTTPPEESGDGSGDQEETPAE
jgi:hypothetical protein